ncbi:uncharacterized protein LOC120306546 isoform X2 [Crotalus tigris]|uniref:uncharacterized protein LOC120306546 isoform X2 n=1 Tax=Crotalus tigris TaxID=88082 RepID=UPI00192F80EA|nr:uncharacterized protein LOC120306546 isoform X2 [Crotalus tigris]
MDRHFFPPRQRFRGRGHNQWFHQNNIPNENFWMDTWDMPQDQFPGRPPPWWNQHCPEQERPYNIGFDNYIRGSYQRRPYRGPYKRSKKIFSRGRGNFQNPSSSPCLINVTPKKKFEKVKKQPKDSMKFKQDKGNTATSVKKDDPSKVKPNDSQPAEASPSQTASAASPGATAEEKSPSGITKVPPHTQSEDIVLDKLKNCDAAEDLLSQTVSILSPEVSTEDKTSSCSTEVLHNIEEKDSVLGEKISRSFLQESTWGTEKQASQSALDSSHVCSSTAVEIPFLSDNVNDDQSERREEIEMTETPAKQNDTEDSQVCVAPALDFSSLPSALSDIPCVSVLVREKDTRVTETSAKQNDTEDSQVCEVCVAPALDSSSLLSALSDIPCVPVLVREKDMGLTETSAKQNDTEDSQVCVAPALDSSSLSNTLSDIPCISVLVREKDNELTETSAKQNDTDDSEVCVAPALHSSSLPSVLSDIPCVSVLVREKDNGLIETSAKQNDTEDCQVYVIPALHSSSLPSTFSDIRCVPVLVREKDTRWADNQRRWAPEDYQEPPWSVNQTDQCHKVSECYKDSISTSISSNEKHNVESLIESKSCFQKIHHSTNSKHFSTNQTSRDLHGQSSRSYGRQDCNSRSSGKRDLSTERQDRSSKLSCRWKEVGKLGRNCGFHCHCHCHCQQSCSPSRESLWQRCCSPSHLTCKIKHLHVSREISNVYGMPCHFSPERSVAPSTKKKETTSSCHLNAEEETNSSAPSWTPKDRSAAVLARKEELEQAYLQVLLNFGVIAIMLVEKEPCMIEAMSSALRANLRKIGDYYECLLKNYIDSLS